MRDAEVGVFQINAEHASKVDVSVDESSTCSLSLSSLLETSTKRSAYHLRIEVTNAPWNQDNYLHRPSSALIGRLFKWSWKVLGGQ